MEGCSSSGITLSHCSISGIMTNLLYLSHLHSGCNTYLMHKLGWRKFQRPVSAAALCAGRAVLTCRTSWAPLTASAMSEPWLWPPHLWDCSSPSARILPANLFIPVAQKTLQGCFHCCFADWDILLWMCVWVIKQKCSSSTSYCVYCTWHWGRESRSFCLLELLYNRAITLQRVKRKTHCALPD